MVCFAVAAFPWYHIFIVLQIDQCRYFITVFITMYIRYMTDMYGNTHIADTIHAHVRVKVIAPCLEAPAERRCDNWLVTRPLLFWLSMIINNSCLSGTTDTRPVVIRFQVWSFYTKLKYTCQLVIISFIDIISMEIRLTILNGNEIECFMNGTMPTIILKITLSKLHCIELSFVRWELWATQLMLHQNSSKYQQSI